MDKRLYRDFDVKFSLITLAVCVIGLLAIYSATRSMAMPLGESYAARQANWMALAAALFLIGINISYQRFIDISYILYGANVLLLAAVLAMGSVRLGAQRWFSIGSFAFQPSEFMKLSLILALANYIGSRREAMSSARSLIVPIMLMALPFTLVLLQPDLGTALLLAPVFFAMLFVGGARVKYLAIMLAMGFASMPFLWHFLRGYQKQRLLVFINPNIDPLGAGYTIIQSKIAIGSGGLFGKGWLAGTQSQLDFLPEHHTDFIFSVIGEEWGLVGALGLLVLYFLISNRSFRIAAMTHDIYGKLVATGIAVMISLQVIINIGMTVGLMPVVGVPLPLVSYGGSSMIATVLAVTLLLNIAMRRSRF